MSDLLAGTTVKALDTPPTVANAQSASVSTQSTTYTTVGADCAVVWTAPTTGRVLIHIAARMQVTPSTATSGALIAPQTRTGGVIGSGTLVEDAADQSAASHYGGTAFERQGIWHLLTGLTPGAVYNTRLLMKSSTGVSDTANFAHRELIVAPAT
ncbi:hypothetical protein ACWGQ5_34330 [Streptomyces sp. NPDC055722]